MTTQKQNPFEVVVGNIGTVYSGSNLMVATCKWAAYVKQSRADIGRAAGESVTLFHNGEIRREYIGTADICPTCY
jgi:hypothetical protein